jgi:hypothetical protein
MDEEACFGCRVSSAKSSSGFENREGTVPARARLTFDKVSVAGTSGSANQTNLQTGVIPSGIVGSTGVLLGEVFELPPMDQNIG